MSNTKKDQGFLIQYFIEKDKDRGISYAYGLRKDKEWPFYFLKTAPIVRFERNSKRFFTHYGVYSVGELITDPSEKAFYRYLLAESEIHFMDDFVASVPFIPIWH